MKIFGKITGKWWKNCSKFLKNIRRILKSAMRSSKRYTKSENKISQERSLKRMRSKWSKRCFYKKSLEETSSNNILKHYRAMVNKWKYVRNSENIKKVHKIALRSATRILTQCSTHGSAQSALVVYLMCSTILVVYWHLCYVYSYE